MKKFFFVVLPPLVLVLLSCLLSCGKDETTSPTWPQAMEVKTIITGLEYPTGLWLRGSKVYFTETRGRNTVYGGKIALSAYNVLTKTRELLVNNPVNSDAVVVASDGKIYLTSYQGSIPGDFGQVSVVNPVTHAEIHVVDIEIASRDMCIEPDDDIYIIGSSDTPTAKSIYLLPAGDYTHPVVLYQGLGRALCIARSGPVLYYSDETQIRLISDTGWESFVNKSVASISLSSKYLYYVDRENGKVGAINKSTLADTTIVSGLNSPQTVRWDETRKELYFIEAGTDANQYTDGTLKVIKNFE